MSHHSPRVEDELRHRDLYREERRARLDGLLLACLRNPRSREPLDALTRYLSDTRDPAAYVTRYAVGVVAGPLYHQWGGAFVLRYRLGDDWVTEPALLAQQDNAGSRLWPANAWGPFCRIWDRLVALAEKHQITTGRGAA